MSWLIRRIISASFLLPLNIIIVLSIELLVLQRRPRLGKTLIVIAWASLWLFSTPAVSFRLQQSIQVVPALSLDKLPVDAQAIVVLGSGS